MFRSFPYRGNSATQTVTNGIDLYDKGGLVWIKKRSGAENHILADTERGLSNFLMSNSDNAANTNGGPITSFDSNGFKTDNNSYVNTAFEDYASWTFRKAPGFFDVVTYTGTGSAQSIAHSLGSVPGMVIVKCTSTAGLWVVNHVSTGAGTGRLFLDRDNESSTGSAGGYWNSTAPTSTHFTVGGDGNVNANGETFVAYIFGNDDLIKCGSYTGSSAPNNVNIGFQPQFLITKRTDSSGDWGIYDSARSSTYQLVANETDAESSGSLLFNTTGFTLGNNWNEYNANGGEYIYVAIKAPNPLDYAVGTYYPMFAVKAHDADGEAIPSANSEIPMRNALSFNTSLTTELTGNETVSSIISILDTYKYTCNSEFGAGGNKISGIMIRHYKSDGTLYTGGEASFEFDSTNFNIYDNACNVVAVAGPATGNTVNDVTRACGTISDEYIKGLSNSVVPYAWVNQSNSNTGPHTGNLGWENDSGDYCFLGVGTYDPSPGADDWDKEFSGNTNVNPGLAFGISDSDGRGSQSETTPREGIGRRSASLDSMLTNTQVEKSGSDLAHSGHTVEGYFVVYGKYLSD